MKGRPSGPGGKQAFLVVFVSLDQKKQEENGDR